MGTPERKLYALVVDDEETDRNLARDIFLREGFTVEEATNGREALMSIRSRHYDVIVLDIFMPYVDGYEVMRHLKSRAPETLGCVVVVSRMNLKDMKTFFPGCEVIQKPTGPEELAKIAREFREKSRR